MAEITKTVQVTKTIGNYNIKMGRDLLHELGAHISFSTKTISLNDVRIDMKLPTSCIHKDMFHVEEELFVSDQTDRIKYKPADLKELTDNLPQLNNNQKEKLHTLPDK